MNCPYYQDSCRLDKLKCNSPKNPKNLISDYHRCESDEYTNCPYFSHGNNQHFESVQTARRVRVKCPGCGKEFIITIA